MNNIFTIATLAFSATVMQVEAISIGSNCNTSNIDIIPEEPECCAWGCYHGDCLPRPVIEEKEPECCAWGCKHGDCRPRLDNNFA